MGFSKKHTIANIHYIPKCNKFAHTFRGGVSIFNISHYSRLFVTSRRRNFESLFAIIYAFNAR